MRSAYEQLHPGLYRYSGKAEMDGYFATLDRRLSHDQSLQDAFLAFSEFAAKVRCGHTQANPFNQSKQVVETLFKKQPRVPFYFVWLDRHMIVIRNFSLDQALLPGTEVLNINGVKSSAILAKLLSIARADGGNDSKRIAQLAVNGDSEFETFDLYFPLLFPFKSNVISLQIRKPNSRKAEAIVVTPLTFEQRVAPIRDREKQRNGGDEAMFEWKYLPDGSGYVRMPSWAMYNSKWNWKKWLNEHLDEAVRRNVRALILDLRGNEGGDDVGNEIIAHLIDEPIVLSPLQRLVRYREAPAALVPYLDTWDKSFLKWGNSAVDLSMPWPTTPGGVSYLKLTQFDDTTSGDVIKPRGERFHGKLLVLIDAANSSATFQFAQNVRVHHLGTLIGQTTGGSQRGINGGAFFFLRLPNSGIEMDLPLIGTFPASNAPNAGITPDIEVKLTSSDISIGRDAGLETAVRAIPPSPSSSP